jgi:peptidoglycan-associated lipoprotein
MRRIVVLVLTAAGLVTLSGCPKKPPRGECKSSADCAAQEGFGKICVEGRCQECAKDTDCKEGFVCRANRCAPKPQCASDADCPEGRKCDNERCVAPREAELPRKGEGEGAATGTVTPECADPAAFTIRFGFDLATLSGDSQSTLQKLAACLKQAPAKRVTIAGHCDERGTTQYNIALGSRRAEAARKYLSDLGAAGKLDTVSFGEEKPLCTEVTEACWAKNRRVEFQVDR